MRGLTKEERIYNYRLSRARRMVENAFGILTNRFRVLHTPMCMKPDRAEAVVTASCVLHYILRDRSPPRRKPDQEDSVSHEVIPGTWREDPPVGEPVPTLAGNTSTKSAKDQRNHLRDYFSSPEGSIPWQESRI